MSHAEKCPVCEGSGKFEKKECHGCSGKGWIIIQDNVGSIIYYYPQYIPPVYSPPYYPGYPATPDRGIMGDPQWTYTSGTIVN